jgi:phosphatidylglycerophosphate synthase
MPAAPSLAKSISLHGILFFLGQAALMVALAIAYRMQWPRCALFLGIAAAYHAVLTGILLARRADFHVEGATELLPRVNLPNTLTFARLSSIPSIMYLILQAPSYPVLPVLLPFICVVFATDFIDGMVARRRGQITFVGRYLDSSSDYLMIVAVSIVYYALGLLPLWLFLLIMGRLVLFAIGMALLALREGKTDPLATFLGKASIFALMVLYALEIAELLSVPWIGDETVVRIMEYLVAAVVAVSVVDKALFLWRMFTRPSMRRPARSARPRRSGS